MRPNFDQPTDPFGNEVHCHTCDAVMVQDPGDLEWVCNEYHEEDLLSQDKYKTVRHCPVCGHAGIDCGEPEEDSESNVKMQHVCMGCGAAWYVYWKYDRYEMIGKRHGLH